MADINETHDDAMRISAESAQDLKSGRVEDARSAAAELQAMIEAAMKQGSSPGPGW